MKKTFLVVKRCNVMNFNAWRFLFKSILKEVHYNSVEMHKCIHNKLVYLANDVLQMDFFVEFHLFPKKIFLQYKILGSCYTNYYKICNLTVWWQQFIYFVWSLLWLDTNFLQHKKPRVYGCSFIPIVSNYEQHIFSNIFLPQQFN